MSVLGEAGAGGGHRHLTYQSVSMVSAVACPECGVFVAGGFVGEHNRFHDLLDAIARRGVVVIEGVVEDSHEHGSGG
jgi:hypothetical protein